MFVQLDIDHSARKRCRECGRLLSLRRFRLAPGTSDHRATRCDDCEDPDPFTLHSIW
ncbi:hypothetical protein AB0E04_12965 [Streptomyces sp. NPDC048251]|uniref:hypothetical protein n=1 Tax=Streptomyces sp. NPDC048251 TaxID=3154501 RepID=UPI003433D3AA